MHSSGTPPRSSSLRRSARLGVAVVSFLALLACTGLFGSAPLEEDLGQARQQLADGQLPEALASYRTLYDAHPSSSEAASGYAYMLLLAGQSEQADEILASVDFGQSADVSLRRALIALERGDFDGVRDHGERSGTAAGKVMAAEVLVIDLELDAAIALFTDVAGGTGPEAETAREYLALLQNEDSIQRSLANPVALWSLGLHEDACEGAENLLLKLPADETRSAALLLWAGRAVTTGQPRIARSMLDAMASVPEGAAWRVEATRAMIDVAEGHHASGIRRFDGLIAMKRGVPVDGLEDARVTACALAGDPDVAQRLVRGLNSPGAARCLLDAGAVDAARTRVAGPALGRLLENLP